MVVISWDGIPTSLMDGWMADGTLPHFASLAGQGIKAEYAQSVDPTLSATAQSSLATGASPARTGMVSNAFHNPADSFYWYRQGIAEPLDQAEPVWVSASKAGLKSAALFFTGGSLDLPQQAADYTVGYGVRDAYSRQETVPLALVDAPWQGSRPASFSPPYEGAFFIPSVAQVHLYVLDSTDDQTSNYDTVLLSTGRNAENNTPRLKAGEWGALLLVPSLVAGADFLIQEISPGAAPAQVKLFYSNVLHNSASPRRLLQEINQKFGFFPAGADSYALEHGWITPEDDLYLLERQARWMAQVTAWVKLDYHPDLLFTWQGAFDAAGHSFYLVDPRQLNYSAERAAQYANYMRRAAQAADQALEIMLRSIDLQSTTLLLVSDHGMAPLHTTVYVNTVLQRAGLLALDRRNYVLVNSSKAFAVTSGGAAHIYINLKGYEADGIVPASDYSQVQAKIVALLQAVVDPLTGAPVFPRVLRHDELAPLGLDHPNAGAVFVQAAPGYHLDDWRGKKVLFEPAIFYGQHGYDSRLPEMRTFFIAVGAGVPRTGQVIPPVQIIDYAATLASMLGFAPAQSVEGQPIPALAGER